MRFDIEWPDGARESCYSPSLVIQDYFETGQNYPLPEFLERSRIALGIASDRVQQKFGFPCARAIGQLARIEAAASRFAEPAGNVSILSFQYL